MNQEPFLNPLAMIFSTIVPSSLNLLHLWPPVTSTMARPARHNQRSFIPTVLYADDIIAQHAAAVPQNPPVSTAG